MPLPFVPPRPAVRPPLRPVPLTPREREVFCLVAQGATVPQTAAALGVSANTIKTHVKSAYAKLNVQSRAVAAHTARQMGLLGEPLRDQAARTGTPGL